MTARLTARLVTSTVLVFGIMSMSNAGGVAALWMASISLYLMGRYIDECAVERAQAKGRAPIVEE